VELPASMWRFWPQSIQRAVSLVGERYPNGNVRVKIPLDAEGFFMKDTADRAGIVGCKQVGERHEAREGLKACTSR
jgi:hypothetical protein